MRFKIPAFWQAILIIIIAYLVFDNAFPPLLPQALMIQYMIITVIGVLLYFSFNEKRWAEFKAPIFAVLTEQKLQPVRWAFLVLIPLLTAYTSYNMVKPSLEAPVELRQVHPAPPSKLKLYNKTFDLSSQENPVRRNVLEQMRKDPQQGWNTYKQAVGAGRDIYYQNCFYCHGDLLDGGGHYANGFNPLPINFQDVGTIAQLQEAFLFWRITTGGPGLPREGTPWNSAMPVWHEMLSEEDVWNTILFLYDYVDQVPRMWDAEMSRQVTGMKEELKIRRKKMKGNELYQFRCAVCHGERGAGDGIAAEYLYPRPRDFTLALFKYKTSPPQSLPRDEDLFNTIKHGLPGSSMPGWDSLLSEIQMRSLIPVIKSFDTSAAWAPEEAADEDFDEEGRYLKQNYVQQEKQEPVNERIAFSEASVAKGKPIFKKVCGECHGKQGRGNITSGKRLEDDWGYRIWPRNLTKPWTWRASEVKGADDTSRDATIQRIYERLSIGIPGTPMPAHREVEEGNKDPLSLENRWHVANYVYTLRDTTVQPKDKKLLTGIKIEGDLPDDANAEVWKTTPAVTLPLVPNIIKKERLFTPLNDAVSVRVLYNEAEIAFLLEVDDRTDSRPGEKVSTKIQDENLKLHSDAFAIQFPKQGAFATDPVVVKPLYRHGDKSHPTSIWYWNAGSVEPAVAARSAILDANGPDAKLVMRQQSDLNTKASWSQGQWKIVMKRPRKSNEQTDLAFIEGQYIPVSFANWDGSNGEVGSRHTLTSWYWLLLPPQVDAVRVYGLPLGAALLMFIGLLLVRRSRHLC
jgi:DMSO reductase family type II enzyme heme b subunit